MQCMARKRTMKRRKLEPAVQSIAFSVPNGVSTIDLSQAASLVNRRFYRQGINWVVAGFRVYKATPTETGAVGLQISKLPNSWVLGNAWEKAFRHWQDLNKRAVEAGESLPGRFTDFKVYMDAIHHAAGSDANLMPIDHAATAADPGEWEYSKIIIPKYTTTGHSSEYEILATGANYPGVSAATGLDAVSMIEGYAASRGLPNIQDPNTPDDAADAGGTDYPQNWLSAIDNEGNSQIDKVITDLTTENNSAPYPFENGPNQAGGTYADTQYPGGANQLPGLQVVDVSWFNAGTNANKIFLKGDNFPCGLIRLDSSAAEPVSLIVDMVPGTHRGYLCENMTEM